VLPVKCSMFPTIFRVSSDGAVEVAWATAVFVAVDGTVAAFISFPPYRGFPGPLSGQYHKDHGRTPVEIGSPLDDDAGAIVCEHKRHDIIGVVRYIDVAKYPIPPDTPPVTVRQILPFAYPNVLRYAAVSVPPEDKRR